MHASPIKASLRAKLDERIVHAHLHHESCLTINLCNDHLAALHTGHYYRGLGYPVVVTIHGMESFVHVVLADGNDDLIIDIPPSQRILYSFPADITEPLPSEADIVPLFG